MSELDIGLSLGTDHYLLTDELTEREREMQARVREFVDTRVLPVIGDYWDRAEFPFPLVPELAKLDVAGDDIEVPGREPVGALAAGLVHMELNRGDGSLGAFLAIQSGLVMRSIAVLGSDAQRERWLPALARLEAVGAFALTEPDHGSDSVALESTATRDGDDWVLEGRKRWIGNASFADVVVVWARDTGDDEVKGFLVPQGTPGLHAEVITGKGSVRAVWQTDVTLSGARVAEADRLPGMGSFADLGPVLTASRTLVAWMSLGHAVAAYECALSYCRRRRQFGEPLVNRQLVQEQLATMLADVTGMQLHCFRLARLAEDDRLIDAMASLAKLWNARAARRVVAQARDLLGGNGILLDHHVMRHMTDLESLYTFEGTDSMQALIVGRDVTGVSAFR